MQQHAPEIYEQRFLEYVKLVRKNPTIQSVMDTLQRTRLLIPPLQALTEELMRTSGNPESFLVLVNSPEIRDLVSSLHVLYGEDFAPVFSTSLKYAHAHAAWELNGRRIYEVHPDLAWALQRTDLKGFETDDLQLPFKCVYLELPENIQVYNDVTGDHPARGVYVVEEALDDGYRTWRFVMVGKENDTERSKLLQKVVGYDDSLYHFHVQLREPTIDACIDRQKEITRKGGEGTADWKGGKLEYYHPPVSVTKEFETYQRTMDEVFRYTMNCMIYATMSEADVILCEASKEYRALKERAQKAKGEKRKKLHEKLRDTPSRTRYVLGSRTVIDRKKTKTAHVPTKGRTLEHGTMVPGHWQHYWTGEGRKVRVRKLKLPHWRGPVDPSYGGSTHKTVLK